MIKSIIAASTLAITSVFAADTTPSEPPAAITATLATYAPLSVDLSEEVLTITLPQPIITDKIYQSVIKMGVCSNVWMGEEWDGISEIAVLNEHSKQGYIFEGGYEECKEIGELPRKKTELYIMGKTMLY